MTTSDLDSLFDQLRQAQQQFSEMIQELHDSSSYAVSNAQEQWSAPLREWWVSIKASAHPEISALYEKLVDHGQLLFTVAELLGKTYDNPGKHQSTELLILLEQLQRSLGESLGGTQGDGQARFSPMGHLLDVWRNHASILLGVPDPIDTDIFGVGDKKHRHSLNAVLGGLFNAGANSDHLISDSVPELIKAITDYQKQFNRYTQLAVRTAGDAISRMESALESVSPDEPYGVRDFYSHWLQSCELAYDDLVREEEFSVVYAGLVNSAVRVRAARQKHANGVAATMGFATQDDVRQLARALHETRRELRRSRHSSTGHHKTDLDVTTPNTDPISDDMVSSSDTTRHDPDISQQKNPTKTATRKKKIVKIARAKTVLPKKKAVTKKTAKKNATKKKVAARRTDTQTGVVKKAARKKKIAGQQIVSRKTRSSSNEQA